jgi:two-component system alkaline phosphatase synthesis response regulator PhoP
MGKVLVVDDQPNIVRLLQFHLEKEHDVFIAFNGQEALDLVDRECPQLIILDVVMPVLDGYRVLHRLKSNPQTRAITVIMLTKKDEPDDVILGYNVGADYYVSKPFNVSDIVALVRRHLGARPADAE